MNKEAKQQTDAESQAEANNIDFGDEPETEQSVEAKPEDQQDQQASEDKGESFINQEAVNKRINEITFEKYEEKRKAERLQEELDQLKAKLEKDKQQTGDITIPDMPDVYDDDYEVKMRAREEALLKSAELKARKAFQKEQEQKAIHDKMLKQQQEVNKQVENMFSQAEKHGISKEDMIKADQTVSTFIKDASLARFILAQPDSALIVKYLSSSATELEKLSSLDTLSASVHIATKIAQDAAKLKKPNITQTPDPIDIPSGKAAPNDDPYLKGATFE